MSFLSKCGFAVLLLSLALGFHSLNPEIAMSIGDFLASLGGTQAATLRVDFERPDSDHVFIELQSTGYVKKTGKSLQNPPTLARDVSSSGVLSKEFSGARVLVVGGSKGIGRGIATVLSRLKVPNESGLRVITVGRSKPGANEPKTERVNADLASIEGCKSLVDNLKKTMGTEKFTHIVFTIGAWPDWNQPTSPDGYDRVLQIDIISRAKVFFGLQAAGLLENSAQITSVLASAMNDYGMGVQGVGMKQRFQKCDSSYKYSPMSMGAVMLTAGKSNDVFLYEAAKRNPTMSFVGGFPGIVKTEVMTPTLGSVASDLLALLPGAHSLEESGFRHVNMMWRARQLRDGGVVTKEGLPANLFFYDHTVTAREGLAFLLNEPSYGVWLWGFLQSM